MFVAGEASGDLLTAELAQELREILTDAEADHSDDRQPLHASLEPCFFGAGGPRMAGAGVELAADLTALAATGVSDVARKYFQFRKVFHRLMDLARERQPHAIVCADFSGFNLRLARAIKRYVRRNRGTFHNWEPKIVQYISPQVWGSRPGRAQGLAQNVDLLLSIFPFEKDWYATHAPGARVEFVGHPVVDRYAGFGPAGQGSALHNPERPLVLLLPGSRVDELRRHVPVIVAAAWQLGAKRAVESRMVLPDARLAEVARSFLPAGSAVEIQVGGLAAGLARADLAIASTGTVTMECAYFGVPTVALYKTSRLTYAIAKRLIQVGFVAMPNLLLGQALYPEFIQNAATPENLAREAMRLLDDEARRKEVKAKLEKLIRSLGPPGATRRAARAVAELLLGQERL
jgi:lipid-A-disaccharide synthase